MTSLSEQVRELELELVGLRAKVKVYEEYLESQAKRYELKEALDEQT